MTEQDLLRRTCSTSMLTRWILPGSVMFAALLLGTSCHAQEAAAAAPQQRAAEAADRLIPRTASHKVSHHDADAAEDAYLQGAKQIRDRHYADAETSFERAAKLNPEKDEYALAVAMTHERQMTELLQASSRARLAGRPQESASLLAQARAIDPTHPLLQEHEFDGAPAVSPLAMLAQKRFVAASAIRLAPSKELHSFHERGDLKTVLQHVGDAYGVRMIFDDAIHAKSFRLDIDDVDFATAMTITERLGTVFVTAIDPKTALIAPDTPENRTRLERLAEETIPLEGMTVEQLNDVANLLKNIFEVKQIVVQPSQGVIVLRAPVDTVDAVNLILDDLINSTNEVMIELKIYSIDASRDRNTGLTPPQTITAYSPYSEAQSIVNSNSAALQQLIASGVVKSTDSVITKALALILSGVASSNLLTNSFLLFGGGISSGLLSSGGATLALSLTNSDTRTLDDVQLRIGDRQTATFRVGTRYPIPTGIYSGVSIPSSLANQSVNGVSVSSLLGGGSSSVSSVPQVQFEDLGLTLKATPRVQRGHDIFLHLDFKLEALAGAAINTLPVLASRQFTSDVTLGEGTTATLISLVSKSEAGSLNGYPGLTELPGFQSVTGDDANAVSSTLIMFLTPHLVRRSPQNLAGPYIPLAPRAGVAD